MASLPRLRRAQAREAAALRGLRLHPLGGFEMRLGFVDGVLHEPRAGDLAPQANRGVAGCRPGLERRAEGLRGAGRVAGEDTEVADALPEVQRQLGLRDLIRTHLLVQTLRLGTRLGAELLAERVAQPLVRSERLAAATGQRVQPDQLFVRFLAQRVLGDDATHRTRRTLEIAARLE